MQRLALEIKECRDKKMKLTRVASEQIFNVLNTQEDFYEFIDLHGQFVAESRQIVSSRIKDVREAVVTG
jgi:hypothetical protein